LKIPKGQSEYVYRRRTDNTYNDQKKKYKRTGDCFDNMDGIDDNHCVHFLSIILTLTRVSMLAPIKRGRAGIPLNNKSTCKLKEEFEDTKGAIRICISKKNRQHVQ
jgi:hypothetical protein